MVCGVTLPWTLGVSAALGIWVMASPALLRITATAANTDLIAGALVTTVAAIAMTEVGRALRLLNVLLGAWLAAAPWIAAGAGTGAD
jgi:hypothetical protein